MMLLGTLLSRERPQALTIGGVSRVLAWPSMMCVSPSWVALAVIVGASLPQLTSAHGRLLVPMTRVGHSGYENDPVPSHTGEEFVCRHAEANPAVQPAPVSAGGKLSVRWYFSAIHVGDCALFISYDVDKPRRLQRYVKIANLPTCRNQEGKTVQIDIPAALPAGRAILRWDWRALHNFPLVEWYAHCADVVVSSTSSRVPSDLDSFSIISPPIYPAGGREGVGFRNPYGDGADPSGEGWFLTGPACIDGSLNDCDLTAAGTRGHTNTSNIGPIEPECKSTIVVKGDTPASVMARLGSPAKWADICAMNLLKDCNVLPVGDVLVAPPCPPPSTTPTTSAPPTTRPTTSSTPAPTLSPTATPSSGRCCYFGGCEEGATCAGEWCSTSPEVCSQCSGTWCPGSVP